MISIIFFLLLQSKVARAAFPQIRTCEPFFLGHLSATAQADPEDLVAVLVSLWPAGRPIFERLADMYRRGWLLIGIDQARAETVLEHTFNLVRAVRAYGRAHYGFDVRRAMWMALIHDLPEYFVGDITPRDGIDPDRKFRAEWAAMRRIVRRLGSDARILETLWLEFERGESPEARAVRQLDALDVVPSALRYELMGFDVSDFYRNVGTRLTDKRIETVLTKLLAVRAREDVDFRDYYLEALAVPRF